MNLHFAIFFVSLQWPATLCLQVNQNPLELILLPGVPLKVTCSITGTDNPNLYWYRWTPTDGFKLMFSSLGKGQVDPESVGDFSSNRPGSLQILLESKSVTHIGSAVWYCAASSHSVTDYSESCTKTLRPCVFTPGIRMVLVDQII
ncbi:hypothetical protein R3I93_011333 [Phoxinus phoxinus]|uniref:Ig-like domain-containing protein n=1 Tax=Phoxinus phoxinus TaxID=58324 RepID=A0AAN9H891_9TELE